MEWEDERSAEEIIKTEHRLKGIYSFLSGYYDKVIEHPNDPDGFAEPSYELV